VIIIEEVARACAASSLIPAVNKLVTVPLLLSGAEELKRTSLRPVARGEALFSYALSEAGAGSDAASMRTRAVQDRDHWVLNGTKMWISNAGVSQYYTVMAVTDPARGSRGISAFPVGSAAAQPPGQAPAHQSRHGGCGVVVRPADGSRIMVTGVGGAPGFDLAVSLLKRGIGVIGLDADPLAPGLVIPGIIPRITASADSPGYPAGLLGLCRELRPAALFSTVEHELPALIRMRHDLVGLGVRTWLPDLDGAQACIDKAAFCTALARNGLPVPRTWLPSEISQVPDGIPLVVKPRYGQGSKGVYFCSDRHQVVVLSELAPDPVIQEFVPGREFTADCLVGRDGRSSVILRWRLLVKGGLSVVSATFRDEEVVGLVRRVLAAIGAAGPCCVQGIIRDDGHGSRVQFIEANARFAGAFRLSEEAGADLVGQALNGMFGTPVDHAALAYRPGIYLTKYTETLAVGPRPAAPAGERQAPAVEGAGTWLL
jgi:carbamoyl-phosphate synthase large subunit